MCHSDSSLSQKLHQADIGETRSAEVRPSVVVCLFDGLPEMQSGERGIRSLSQRSEQLMIMRKTTLSERSKNVYLDARVDTTDGEYRQCGMLLHYCEAMSVDSDQQKQ